MIQIVEKERCCGCTACASVCPQHCIAMTPDQEGFLYPAIDQRACIDCGLCIKVCPASSGFDRHPAQAVYAARHRESAVVDASTSGGAFTAFAAPVLAQSGAVFGAGYDQGFNVVHRQAEHDPAALAQFRGSKYVQSDLGDTFRQVKATLAQNRKVLFSGTPCQVAGLNNYLGRADENLLTLEVICHGTPSPLLWRKYLDAQTRTYRSQPVKISFRKKTYGYHSGTMEIIFENGKRYTGSARVDPMLKSFFSEIASRPCCYACLCKGTARAADVSVYDCWHMAELAPGARDDDRGYTSVMLNTPKGVKAFDEAKSSLEARPVDMALSMRRDGVMICNNPVRHPNRDAFYRALQGGALQQAVKQYIPVSGMDRALEKSKGLVHWLGLTRLLKKIRR